MKPVIDLKTTLIACSQLAADNNDYELTLLCDAWIANLEDADKLGTIRELMDIRNSIESPSVDWDIYKALQTKIIKLVDEV